MSNQGFTNTFILEANRLSSEQVKAGNNSNNALFTNKVNNGLKLDAGDVVGVHSAYISELGAEGSDIEIIGRDIDTLNASQILTYNIEKHNGAITTPDGSDNASFLRRDDIYNGFILNQRISASESIPYRDDTINMVMNPYKNTNGEFYMPLPYNYAPSVSLSPTEAVQEAQLWNNEYINRNLDGSASNVFAGATTRAILDANIQRRPIDSSLNTADNRIIPKPEFQANTFDTSVRHDNARFSIFQLSDTIHLDPLYPGGGAGGPFTENQTLALSEIIYKQTDDEIVPISNASYKRGLRDGGYAGNASFGDMATFKYVRVQNKITANANTGYNSNNDVSSKITEDLLRTEDIITTPITTYADNQVNKTYSVATIDMYNYPNYATFNEHVGVTANDDSIYGYIAAHETIGVKRPDLFELGRSAFKVVGDDVRVTFYTGNSASNTQGPNILETNIPWTEENLLNLKKLADAQQRYPELFDTDNMPEAYNLTNITTWESVNHFFLHVNRDKQHQVLGYDLNDNNASYWTNTITGIAPNTVPSASFTSCPVFFDINTSTTEKGPNDIEGTEWENSVYGFAIRTGDTISLKTTHHYDVGQRGTTGGLDLGASIYHSGTRLGWDYHFTAYGCPCILLWNGYCGRQGTGYDGVGLGISVDQADTESEIRYLPEQQNRLYLGSGNATMNFSPQTDRFEIRNLHTSEKIGNLYNAGYTADIKYEKVNASTGVVEFTNPDIAVPTNPNAAENVYKLNKQLLRNNFTPCMAPYNTEVNASFFTRYDNNNRTASFTAEQRIEYFNPNFIEGGIYDSTCGNFITDWGMNEKYWNESLWGIMGFRYEQTGGSGTNQTRLTNSNTWSRMIENTTNADINNSDFDSMTRNCFNSPTFLLSLPIAQMPRFSAAGSASHTYSPPVSITQQTGQVLRADALATRTLRPYYTIRSDIIGQSQYLGGGSQGVPLPVVAIVEKVSQSGDYFNLSQSSLQFTVTKPIVITDITTSIHDPDGSFSGVSPNSAVLYKVEKSVKADMNVVSSILQGDNKKQALQFEESLEPPQPTKKDISSVVDAMKTPNNP